MPRHLISDAHEWINERDVIVFVITRYDEDRVYFDDDATSPYDVCITLKIT
jgi:hypothetical protein